MKRYVHQSEQHVVCQYAYNGEHNGVGQQLSCDGSQHIGIPQIGRVFSCRCGSSHPFLRCPELEFAAYGIHRYKKNQYLEQNEEKRLAQIDRVIHIRIIKRMRIGFHWKKERLYLFLPHTQCFSLYNDGRQCYGGECGFKCCHQFASYRKKGVMVIVSQRCTRPADCFLLKLRRDGQVAIYLLPLQCLSCRGFVRKVLRNPESRCGGNAPCYGT